MKARWINTEIATCAIAVRVWVGHFVNVYDRFLIILPRGLRDATRCAPKRVNGKAAQVSILVGGDLKR